MKTNFVRTVLVCTALTLSTTAALAANGIGSVVGSIPPGRAATGGAVNLIAGVGVSVEQSGASGLMVTHYDTMDAARAACVKAGGVFTVTNGKAVCTMPKPTTSHGGT